MSDKPETPAGGPRAERRATMEAELTAAAAIAAGLRYEGSLAQDSPLRLYYLAAAAQATGRLTLATPDATFALHFKKGVPEHASSSDPADDLGGYLVQRGVVSAEQLADAANLVGQFGDLVATLAGLRIMNPAESFRVLQEHGASVVTRALRAEEGTCRWEPDVPLPPSSFPLGSRWGMLCEAVRRLDGLALRKRLGDRLERSAARSGGRVEISELKLSAREARAAGLFDGVRSPAELAGAHPAEADLVVKLSLLLSETELLTFGGERRPSPARAMEQAPARQPEPVPSVPPNPTALPQQPASPADAPARSPQPGPRPAPPVQAPRPAAPAPAAPQAQPARPAARPRPSAAPRAEPKISAAALAAFQEKIARADHFEVLGVKRDAPAPAVKAAYFQLAKTYHPDAGASGEPPEVKKLRADIFARLGEAWDVLGDDGKRAAYLRELDMGTLAKADVAGIFQAEALFRKATVLVNTRQYAAALTTLEQALALNADEAEFAIWKAWVEFLLAEDKPARQPESARVIEGAIKKNPRCIPGYLFLGHMAKLTGDADGAARHWKRGLALEPENAELLREMKHLKR